MLYLQICTGPSWPEIPRNPYSSKGTIPYLSLSQVLFNISDSFCLIGFYPMNAVGMVANQKTALKSVRVTGDSTGDREMDPLETETLKARYTLSPEVTIASCPPHIHSLYSSKKIIQPHIKYSSLIHEISGPILSEQNVRGCESLLSY